MIYIGYPSLFCFGISGRTYSNFVASTVKGLRGIPLRGLWTSFKGLQGWFRGVEFVERGVVQRGLEFVESGVEFL